MFQLKNQRSGSKTVCGFYFNFERNYNVLKSKGPWILLNKNINFNKSKRESKMKNPTYSFRETVLVTKLIWELQIKRKAVMSWSSRKKKEDVFCTVYLVRRNFFNIYVLSQCIVYWIHFHNIHTFTYKKNITSYTSLLAFKIVESLHCILNSK